MYSQTFSSTVCLDFPKCEKWGQTLFFQETSLAWRDIPPPVCLRRPVSLRDASRLRRPVPLRGRRALGGEHEKLKSRPSSFVQDRGPVLGKSKRAVPARCAQVLRSDASRSGCWQINVPINRGVFSFRNEEYRFVSSNRNSLQILMLIFLHS